MHGAATAQAPDHPALALEQITVTFVSPNEARYTAIRDTTLVVRPGEFVSVVGPTG